MSAFRPFNGPAAALTSHAWCRDKGISEAVIWGKGELEDQLYQPKNDNLLFAYFGISLTIRRRSQATQIRSEIATKRKLKKTILLSSADVLLRDPSTEEYPRVKEGERPTKWGVYAPEALGPVDTYRIHRMMAARVSTA